MADLIYERIALDEDASIRPFRFESSRMLFYWHFHPQWELTLTLGGNGRRFVGDHIDRFAPEDLVLLGPNLPHAWQSDEDAKPSDTIRVRGCWMTRPFWNGVVETFPEFARIPDLLKRAERGLAFPQATARKVADDLLVLPEAGPRRRIGMILSVLDALLEAEPDAVQLASSRPEDAPVPVELGPLDRALHLIHTKFMEPLTIADIAVHVGMGESTFYRYFKKRMNQTVGDYISELRLGEASSLLLCTADPVYLIAEKVGFRNLSNFNRQFRGRRGMSPSAFRAKHSTQGAYSNYIPNAPILPRLNRWQPEVLDIEGVTSCDEDPSQPYDAGQV